MNCRGYKSGRLPEFSGRLCPQLHRWSGDRGLLPGGSGAGNHHHGNRVPTRNSTRDWRLCHLSAIRVLKEKGKNPGYPW